MCCNVERCGANSLVVLCLILVLLCVALILWKASNRCPPYPLSQYFIATELLERRLTLSAICAPTDNPMITKVVFVDFRDK